MNRKLSSAFCVLTLLVLAACGGGNGATDGASTPSTPAPEATASEASSADPTDAAEPVTLNVGVTSVTSPTAALLVLAEGLGFAEEYGIDPEFIVLTNDVAAQALAGGDVDLLATPSIQTAILQGLDARVIAGASGYYFSLWGLTGETETWDDLVGKAIAVGVSSGSSGDVFLTTALENNGVARSDVDVLYSNQAAAYQSFVAGTADAFLANPPFTYELEDDPKYALIDDLVTEARSLSTEYTMMVETIESDPQVVERFMAMLLDVQEVMYSEPLDERVVPIMSDWFEENGVDPGPLDMERFYPELASRNVWQVIPTRDAIEAGLELISGIPDHRDAALAADFEDIVYVVPKFESEY